MIKAPAFFYYTYTLKLITAKHLNLINDKVILHQLQIISLKNVLI